jgi:hypothetical protein
MEMAGMREATVRWRHSRRATVDTAAHLRAVLKRFDGALYVLECAGQAVGYGVVTLGAVWLIWRLVP